MFKMQVQEDESHPEIWHDVKGPDGTLLTFDKESEARAELAQRYPVLVKMEGFAGPKRTRVLNIIEDDDK